MRRERGRSAQVQDSQAILARKRRQANAGSRTGRQRRTVMKTMPKRLAAGAAIAALLALPLANAAEARDWRGGGHRHHRGGDNTAAFIGLGLGALALGSVLAYSATQPSYAAPPAYYVAPPPPPPPPAYYAPAPVYGYYPPPPAYYAPPVDPYFNQYLSDPQFDRDSR
jgi:hypothetical protein